MKREKSLPEQAAEMVARYGMPAVLAALKDAQSRERPVLVTTEFRGVFFGYATDTTGDVIHLRACRNCVQWRGLKGFIDLAVSGPNDQCKIGPAADEDIRKITSVAEVSPAAALAWENAPWSQ